MRKLEWEVAQRVETKEGVEVHAGAGVELKLESSGRSGGSGAFGEVVAEVAGHLAGINKRR